LRGQPHWRALDDLVSRINKFNGADRYRLDIAGCDFKKGTLDISLVDTIGGKEKEIAHFYDYMSRTTLKTNSAFIKTHANVGGNGQLASLRSIEHSGGYINRFNEAIAKVIPQRLHAALQA